MADMWVDRVEDKKLAVEARLRGLRNRHRLAMHVWEDFINRDELGFSWNAFNRVTPEEIDQKLQSGDIPLLSMSLLPSDASGKIVKPYGIYPEEMCSFSYLVDMSQDQEHPPRVVRAGVLGLASGSSVDHKTLYLDQECDIASLREYYGRFATELEAKRAVSGTAADRNCELQLDALGLAYENNRLPDGIYYDIAQNVVKFNEIVAAASREHIEAIALPLCVDHRTPESYLPSMKLLGAIEGLRHLDEGLDVPVVIYSIVPPRHAEASLKQGDCTYVGQGREELVDVALQAIRELQPMVKESWRDEDYLYRVGSEVSNYLGIDIMVPLAQQHEAVERLRRGQTAKVMR